MIATLFPSFIVICSLSFPLCAMQTGQTNLTGVGLPNKLPVIEPDYLDQSSEKLAKRLYSLIEKRDIAAARNFLKAPVHSADLGAYRDSRTGYTPLLLAVARGEREIVKLLLFEGSSISEVIRLRTLDSDVLFLAASNGHADIVRDLVNSCHKNSIESQINKRGFLGQTPLIAAASGGHLEMVKFLLTMPGVDVNAVDNSGNTALSRAAKAHANSAEMVKELLKFCSHKS